MRALYRFWCRFLAYYAACEAADADRRGDMETAAMWARNARHFDAKGVK